MKRMAAILSMMLISSTVLAGDLTNFKEISCKGNLYRFTESFTNGEFASLTGGVYIGKTRIDRENFQVSTKTSKIIWSSKLEENTVGSELTEIRKLYNIIEVTSEDKVEIQFNNSIQVPKNLRGRRVFDTLNCTTKSYDE